MRFFSLFDFILERLEDFLYYLPAIIIGITFHEWAHAYVAYRLGDPTARMVGRMTLNPIPHIDIIGFLSLLLLGIGWAKPVPVNPRNFKNIRRDDFFVSIAGITVNIILSFIFYGVWYAVAVANRGHNEALNTILWYLWVININLAIFNLIPVFPLDGFHIMVDVFKLRLGSRIMFFLQNYGRYIILVLVFSGAVGVIFDFVSSGITYVYSQFYALIFGVA